MNPRLPASLFPILCLVAPLAAQGDAVDLRLVAKKGASVWLLQEVKEEQYIDMGGQQMEMSNTTWHTLHVTVKDVDDKGIATVETKIARIHGNASMGPMGEVDFDSLEPSDADDEGGDMAGMLAKAKTAGAGKTFGAKVDANGRVTELAADAKEITAAGEGGMRMGGGIDEATLRRMVETAFGMRPEKPMSPGSTWPHTKKEGNGRMPIENKLELKLTKVDAESFEITGTGTVEKTEAKADEKEAAEGEGEEEAMAREMMKQMKLKNGKISGEQRVSRTDGFVLDSKQNISMDMEMPGPMGDMTVEVKVTVSTKRTTEEAAKPKAATTKPADAKDAKAEAPKEEKK